QYWPAEYLIDGNGNLRRIHFGEGEYAETEDAIRALLNERGQTVKNQMTQVPDETPHIRVTPETYVGLARLERFSADKNITAGSGSFTLPVSFPVHHFGFGGIWDVAPEFSTAAGGSKLRFEFYADKVFLVMHPKTAENKVRVYLDGKLVDRTNSGADAVNGVVTVNEPRLYQIIDLKGKSGEHLLELRFENDGTQVYAFTFG
ncbi:hypothetical protein HY214_04760, partial [Candidatus Roizmanbacteria bacterium]|nr:hypothetical protein [Candidatus Roizmanbacteria bacterium]